MTVIARNDVLARLVRHAGPLQWVMWECECGAPGCRELVTVMLGEFDTLRARGGIVAVPHHGARAARHFGLSRLDAPRLVREAAEGDPRVQQVKDLFKQVDRLLPSELAAAVAAGSNFR